MVLLYRMQLRTSQMKRRTGQSLCGIWIRSLRVLSLHRPPGTLMYDYQPGGSPKLPCSVCFFFPHQRTCFERGREGEREGEKYWCERETSVALCTHCDMGTKPTTQACTLTGIEPTALLFMGHCPNQPSHTSQGPCPKFLLGFHSVEMIDWIIGHMTELNLQAPPFPFPKVRGWVETMWLKMPTFWSSG